MSESSEQKASLRLEILEKMSGLATAGLGLVAALAWNDAIQALFKQLFGDQSSLWAKFLYAALVTVLIIVVTNRLSTAIQKVKERLK